MIQAAPTPTAAQLLAANLQELIQLKHISSIQIYEQESQTPSRESSVWAFGSESLQVGLYWYPLNRILTYECRATMLSLHFVSSY